MVAGSSTGGRRSSAASSTSGGRGRGGRGRGRQSGANAKTEAVDVAGPSSDAAPPQETGDTQGSTEVLMGAAEAIAASLIDGLPLEVVRLRQLRDALLAENGDASPDAAQRCACLRRGLAKAVRQAVSERAGTSHFLSGGKAPPARVEVRNTAGRAMVSDSFAVGRAPECDVQTSGDATVSRLQCVAVSLPGGIVVVDAWSSGGTRTVRRFGQANALPQSVPGRRMAFLVPHGERIVFMLGNRTTIALGPPAGAAGPMLAPPATPVSEPPVSIPDATSACTSPAAAAAAPAAVNGTCSGAVDATTTLECAAASGHVVTTITPTSALGPIPSANGIASATAAPASGTSTAVVAETTAVESANVVGRTAAITSPGTPPGTTPLVANTVTASVQDAVSTPDEAPIAAPGRPSSPGAAVSSRVAPTKIKMEDVDMAPAKTEDVNMAPLTMTAGIADGDAATANVTVSSSSNEIAAAAHPESPKDGTPVPGHARAALSRCLKAVQAGVRLHQAVAAHERLRWRCRAAKRARLVTEEQCAELQEMLKPPADQADAVADILDGLGVTPAPDDPAPGSLPWECLICRSTQRSRGWRCPFLHRSCRDCMAKWAEASVEPSCPHAECGYRLGEHDLEDLRVSAARLDAFRTFQLEKGLVALQDSQQAGSQVSLFRCPGRGCNAAVVVGAADDRRRFVCNCGAPPACTSCGASPYHYHGACGDLQVLRARWLAWLQGGRDAYQGLQKRAVREATAQQRALREAVARHEELEHDEQWKTDNCRLCPKCKRPVEKVDGCNTMICGQNTHGGNRRPGCGHRFKWLEAPPYRPNAGSARITKAPALARVGAISGRGVRHLFAQCHYCGDGEKCISGPRFRCIHCPSFSCCLKCEPRLAAEHDANHVFEVLFEDEIDWGVTDVVLPKGTRARIRRRSQVSDTTMGGEAANSDAPARKRRRQDSGLEGLIKGQRGGKYVLDLAGGMGTRHIAGEDLQPLLTQKQAERLLVASAEGGASLRLRRTS